MAQWIGDREIRQREEYILTYAVNVSEQERLRAERQHMLEKREEELQKQRAFYLDVKITHGSAFGGFSATENDGRRKRGIVPLDHIMLYGRHSSGKEFTYYIEEQNIEICATDSPDELLVRSTGNWFEIRQYGKGRDEGILVQSAVIRKDILYFVILESKHEISIIATD